MKCFYHPEVDGLSDCRLCGRPLCGTCAVEIKGAPYCRECLENRIEQPLSAPAAPLPDPQRSPKVAGWLSVLPGLGLAYLGEYLKALTVALVFTGAIHLADHSNVGGILVPLVWFGQIFFAVQEARRLNREGVAETSPATLRSSLDKDSPMWGGILIGIGVLFLLDQFEMLHFGEIFERFWPVLIIILGVQILLRARRQGSRSAFP